jgi:hypothetical protein
MIIILLKVLFTVLIIAIIIFLPYWTAEGLDRILPSLGLISSETGIHIWFNGLTIIIVSLVLLTFIVAIILALYQICATPLVDMIFNRG